MPGIAGLNALIRLNVNDCCPKSQGLLVVPHPLQNAFVLSPVCHVLLTGHQPPPLGVSLVLLLTRGEKVYPLVSRCLPEVSSDHQCMKLFEDPSFVCVHHKAWPCFPCSSLGDTLGLCAEPWDNLPQVGLMSSLCGSQVRMLEGFIAMPPT